MAQLEKGLPTLGKRVTTKPGTGINPSDHLSIRDSLGVASTPMKDADTELNALGFCEGHFKKALTRPSDGLAGF